MVPTTSSLRVRMKSNHKRVVIVSAVFTTFCTPYPLFVYATPSPSNSDKTTFATKVQVVNVKETLAKLDEKIAKSPRDHALLRERALLLTRVGDRKKAITNLSRALAVKPACIQCIYDRADMYSEEQRFEESYRDYSRITGMSPMTGEDNYYQAGAFHYLGNEDRAVTACQKAISLGYRNFRSYRMLGKILYRCDRYKKAIAQFEKSLRQKPSASAYMYLGKCYRHLGQLDESINQLKSARRLDPNFGDVYFEQCLTYVRMNKLDNANSCYHHWRRLSPRRAAAFPSFADIEMYAELMRKIDSYSQLMTVGDVKPSEPIYERALLFLEAGDYLRAAEELRTYLKLTGWSGRTGATAASICILAFRLAGRNMEANHVAKQASNIVIMKDWPRPILDFVEGRLTERELLTRAQKYPYEEQSWFYIGLTRMSRGKFQEALEALKHAASDEAKEIEEHSIAKAETRRLTHRIKMQVHNRES